MSRATGGSTPGPDKAVHQYAVEHYAPWREELGDLAVLDRPPAFGENISSVGMTEQTVCLGDHYRIGSVVLESARAASPAGNSTNRFHIPDMTHRVQQSGRTGWYYRVLEEGMLSAGDSIDLLERPFPEWSLYRLGRLLHGDPVNTELIRPALGLPLPESWHRTLATMAQTGARPDQARRLVGPSPDQ